MIAISLTASTAVRCPAKKESQAVIISILIVCGGSPKGHETTDPDKRSVFLGTDEEAQCS